MQEFTKPQAVVRLGVLAFAAMVWHESFQAVLQRSPPCALPVVVSVGLGLAIFVGTLLDPT